MWLLPHALRSGDRAFQLHLHHVSNICTITLERSTASAAATSGLLCRRSLGGVLPSATGQIAGFIKGSARLHAAFLLPMQAYALICAFGVTAARARVAPVGDVASGTRALTSCVLAVRGAVGVIAGAAAPPHRLGAAQKSGHAVYFAPAGRSAA